jgi:hypothetical protein
MNLATILRNTTTALADDGLDVRFYEGYSGRGMYGKLCLGIVGDQRDCMQVIAEVIKEAIEISSRKSFNVQAAVDQMMSMETDSMGRAQIVYWQDLTPDMLEAVESDDQSDESDD